MVSMNTLLQDVENLMRDVAEQEVLSRFGRLERAEIQAKRGPGDIVTKADLEAENRLIEGLSKLLPESTTVGEEECFHNPDLLLRLSSDKPVWVIDPLDGTGNFATNKPCFAMICALIENGQTQMGWILDPVAGVCAKVQRGHGVSIGAQRLTITPLDRLEQMTGSLGDGTRKRITARKEAGEPHLPRHLVRYHCCGREYLDLLVGKIHFAHYGGALMPWDHAAGTLMVEEAAGYARLRKDKSLYTSGRYGQGDQLLLAPNEQTFDALLKVLSNV